MGRRWCPECGESRREFQVHDDGVCRTCGGEVVEPPLAERAKYATGRALVWLIGGAVLLGPPAMAVKRVLEGGRLYYTKTVTYTVEVNSGVVPDVSKLLFVWAAVLVLIWGILHGPRRI
jgi:hypothetical protein